MKITIDTDIIKKKGISKDVFFHLLCNYFKVDMSEKPDREANNLGYNIEDIDSYDISIDGISLVEQIIAESSLTSNIPDREYETVAETMISVYPEGIKPGTHRQWGGSVSQVADKLKFLEFYTGERVDAEEAVKATREYVESFREDTKYMQTLPYFIFRCRRDGDNNLEWYSNFLSIVEGIRRKELFNDIP